MNRHVILFSFIAFFILSTVSSASAQRTDFKFKMGSGKTPRGFIQIKPTTVFTLKKGYGIDFASEVNVGGQRGESFITANKPFFFSVNVPEGNYKVTVTIGNTNEPAELTVKAESRRLMLEKISTKPGEKTTKTFVVNIRKPEISTGGKVSLKER